MSTPGVIEEQGRGQQAALESRVLLGAELAGAQIGRRELGTLALDGVQQRPPQHLGFDATLDQVVLRAGCQRGDAEVLVGEPGEHDDRDVGVALGDVVERGDAVRIGQVQVQQNAVRSRSGPVRVRRRPSTGPHHLDVDFGVGDQFLDEQRVSAVVLDQQH